MNISHLKILFYLFLIVILSHCGKSSLSETPAGTFEESTPETVGMKADTLAKLTPYMQRYIDSLYFAGGVVLLYKDNKLVYNKTFGYFDRNKTQATKTSDIFRLASMTKPIVTVAAMQLYEQGKLDVRDPVSKYIPSFKHSRIIVNFKKDDSTYTTQPAKHEITIHHLLTHTSGIAYGFFHPVAGPVYAPFRVIEGWTKDSITLAMNVPKIGKLPLIHEPGEKFTYGINTEVLAYIVELISGLPLDEYIAKNIFKPLGMDDTYFYLPTHKENRLVEVWYRDSTARDNFPISIRDDYPISGHRKYFSGGGGLCSTAPDYLRFASALLNKGSFNGSQILKPQTVDLMMRNQIDTIYLEKGTVQFGYGASLYTKDGLHGRKAGRFSWGGFWQTNFWIDPKQNIAGVVMTNAFDTPRFNEFFNGIEEIVNNAVE